MHIPDGLLWLMYLFFSVFGLWIGWKIAMIFR